MRVLAIGDTHAPFHHPDTLDFLRDLKKRFHPERVVHIGDLGDGHGWSRHERQPDAPGQKDEDEACLAFCRALYKLFPTATACIGNHDTRLAKRCVRAGIPSRLHVTVPEVYDSPDTWEWVDHVVIDGVVYFHGEGYSGADCSIKAVKDNRCSTVMGHVHSVGGIRYLRSRVSQAFGASTGCLVDTECPAFSYGKQYAARPVLGSVVVLDGRPQFIPLS